MLLEGVALVEDECSEVPVLLTQVASDGFSQPVGTSQMRFQLERVPLISD